LSATEIAALRAVLAPELAPNGNWQFPDSFTVTNVLRNWLMVEMALELGLRLGELLKLRLDSLPCGHLHGFWGFEWLSGLSSALRYPFEVAATIP
jgi:integrase